MQNNNTKLKPDFIPKISYLNIDLNKDNIFKENRNKSGIYKWTNLITGKSYIGSAINLSRRLKQYFSIHYLNRVLSKSKSIIYSSLLKYGYSNFRLEILEYCEPNSLLEKEQQYIDTLKPEMNICKIAGSVLGLKHRPETVAKISAKARKCLTIIINIIDKSKIEYSSMSEAAKNLGVRASTICKYANTNKLYKNTYLINAQKYINDTSPCKK
jgi:GIY-YIG catalytic domain/NUMOD1 domain